MNEPRRPRSPGGTRRDGSDEPDGFARAAGSSAAKGALLVGAAVVIGIVLLQVVDPEGTSPDASDEPPATTTTTAPTDDGTTVPTEPDLGPARPAADVRVLVLNNSAPSGSASEMADQLTAAGWVNQPVLPTNDDPEQSRTGNAVMCREGFEAEASALANDVGEAEVVAFRDPPPPASEQADCVVLVARAE